MQSLNVKGMLTDQELPFSGKGGQKMLNVSSVERLPLEDAYLAKESRGESRNSNNKRPD